MSALALMVFSSCDNKNGEDVDLDNVVEDGFFVAGPATGSDVLAPEYMMAAGFNEVEKEKRDGMYEKYIVLEAEKDFYLTLNEAGESLRYSAELQDINLADRKDEAAYADNPKIVIRKGKLVEGPDAPAMRVENTGLYHIVLDLNKAGDLEFPQIIVVPCEWGVRGINDDWGFKKMDLQKDGNKYVYSINFKDMNVSTFKFAYCDGWKITLDVDGNVKAETSLGADLAVGGDDIFIKPGADVTISLTYQIAAGNLSKSFSWKAEGVNENYSQKDFTIGVSGDLHSSVGSWTAPEGATRAVYSEELSNPAADTYVYVMEACPFKENAQFKFRKNGWITGVPSWLKVEGVTVEGSNDLTFKGAAGIYKVVFTLICEDLTTVKEGTAVFTKVGDLPVEEVVPTETVAFTVKVKKSLALENPCLYTWYGETSKKGTGEWPGTALANPTEDGDYYVYSCDVTVDEGTTEVNYIVNGKVNGEDKQTADATVTLSENVVVTIDALK